jgi:predicted lipid-binding transport protein (Tim44 family)
MKTFLIALIAALFAGGLMLPDTAEAKRFGGGKSFGKQYSTPRSAPDRQAAQPPSRQQPGQQAAPGQRAPQSGASRWLGPLAGLAAGGLLASLFFGDAFEGFQIMDFLLIAALVFGGFMLFKMLRKRGPTPAVAGAGYGRAGYPPAHPPADPPVQPRDQSAPFGTALGGAFGGSAPDADQPAAAAAGGDAPVWFDEAGFVEGAKTHFIRLQAAWDQADFRDIREYTAPQLFAELKRERDAMGEAPNYTEVVTLNAELVSVQRDADQVVASVRFSGLIREDEDAPAKPLDEIWHVAHDWNAAEGDWLITGIQQAG